MKKVILKQNNIEVGHAIVEDDKAQEMVTIYKQDYKIFQPYPELDESGNPTGLIISPDHSVEIIDLSQDYDFLLSECYKNRIAEYPTLADQMDAFFHSRQGDNTQLLSIDAQISTVKLKYPKPIKE